ncbi:MAG TPA: peptidase U32 family protein [Acidiferrobacterales bacterium]|nr:peptidase U32 family protein [Acidiferrobacterales bacterium]
MELVCPAGSLPALKAAVDNGANAVYLGFRDATNARNFAGLNFGMDEIRAGIRHARAAGAKVFIALNTYPREAHWSQWTEAADRAADLGVDAVIVADMGLLRYCARHHPHLRRHLSVQASATSHEAIGFYARQFGVQRVVLPRVLSLQQVRQVIAHSPVEVEVFGFGSLCIMVEGRCFLSSYVTGESPNTCGVCSPAKAVRWEEAGGTRRSRLNGVLIDVYAPGEPAGYPTLCKGRFDVAGEIGYALEEPTSLNVLAILPELLRAGVAAIKVEGRQRSPAYVAQVTRVLRAALDACAHDPEQYAPRAEWLAALDRLAEGRQHTLGALDRAWQ